MARENTFRINSKTTSATDRSCPACRGDFLPERIMLSGVFIGRVLTDSVFFRVFLIRKFMPDGVIYCRIMRKIEALADKLSNFYEIA